MEEDRMCLVRSHPFGESECLDGFQPNPSVGSPHWNSCLQTFTVRVPVTLSCTFALVPVSSCSSFLQCFSLCFYVLKDAGDDAPSRKEISHEQVRLLLRRDVKTIQRHLPHACKESSQRIENYLRTMNTTRWHKEMKENPRSTSTPCLTSKLSSVKRSW